MRPPVVAVALFCDSVRRENGGSDTLVGVMPDNISIQQIPAMLPRLSLYVRIQFDPQAELSPVSLEISAPDGKSIVLGTLDREIFDAARRNAIEGGKPYAGVIARTEMSPFQVLTPGRVDAIVKTAAGDLLAGHLTFQAVNLSSSNETPPPSPRSPDASLETAKKPGPSRPSRRRASPKRQP